MKARLNQRRHQTTTITTNPKHTSHRSLRQVTQSLRKNRPMLTENTIPQPPGRALDPVQSPETQLRPSRTSTKRQPQFLGNGHGQNMVQVVKLRALPIPLMTKIRLCHPTTHRHLQQRSCVSKNEFVTNLDLAYLFILNTVLCCCFELLMCPDIRCCNNINIIPDPTFIYLALRTNEAVQ